MVLMFGIKVSPHKPEGCVDYPLSYYRKILSPVTVSDINGFYYFFCLYKIYSKTGIGIVN